MALYLATMMIHLSRAQILMGLAACVLLMTVAGALQYRQMPPQARPLARRPPNLQALTVSYASFLAGFVMIALSSTRALPNTLAGAIGTIVVSRLAIALWLLRQKSGRPHRRPAQSVTARSSRAKHHAMGRPAR